MAGRQRGVSPGCRVVLLASDALIFEQGRPTVRVTNLVSDETFHIGNDSGPLMSCVSDSSIAEQQHGFPSLVSGFRSAAQLCSRFLWRQRVRVRVVAQVSRDPEQQADDRLLRPCIFRVGSQAPVFPSNSLLTAEPCAITEHDSQVGPQGADDYPYQSGELLYECRHQGTLATRDGWKAHSHSR